MPRLNFAVPFTSASIFLMTLLSSPAHAVDASGPRADLRAPKPVAGPIEAGVPLVDQAKGEVAIKTSQTKPRRLVIFLHGHQRIVDAVLPAAPARSAAIRSR